MSSTTARRIRRQAERLGGAPKKPKPKGNGTQAWFTKKRTKARIT